MKIEIIKDNLIIETHAFNLEGINSITKDKNLLKIKVGKYTNLVPCKTAKEASINLNKINELLKDKKNFIKCDKNIILNLNNVKYCSVIPVDEEQQEYNGIFNF